jgi:formylglycine-generating enzyme required for sulfatase activity
MNPQFDSRASHGLSVAEHLKRCRQLTAEGHRPVAIAVVWLSGESGYRTASVWHRPFPLEAARNALSARQARAAVALLRLGHADAVWPLLRADPEPGLRTHLIHQLAPLGTPTHVLIQRLREERDVTVQRALVLSLGEHTDAQWPAGAWPPLRDWLRREYRESGDAGLHGAADWLLRRRGDSKAVAEIDRELAGKGPVAGRDWYVSKIGQTLSVVRDRTAFLMGSPRQELNRQPTRETLHRIRIPRSFAIGAKEVTVAQFRRFIADNPHVSHILGDPIGQRDDGPVVRVSWLTAAQYCRWLSEKEGVPESERCYPSIADLEECKAGRKKLMLKPGYLKRTGYRLPTEAEWERACRAGTVTSRSHGTGEVFLEKYAWYGRNPREVPQTVGQLKPNDLGLFDTYGNAGEWCHPGLRQYPWAVGTVTEEEMPTVLSAKDLHVWRGGLWPLPAYAARSAFRWVISKEDINRLPVVPGAVKGKDFDDFVGFRVARTLP